MGEFWIGGRRELKQELIKGLRTTASLSFPVSKVENVRVAEKSPDSR